MRDHNPNIWAVGWGVGWTLGATGRPESSGVRRATDKNSKSRIEQKYVLSWAVLRIHRPRALTSVASCRAWFNQLFLVLLPNNNDALCFWRLQVHRLLFPHGSSVQYVQAFLFLRGYKISSSCRERKLYDCAEALFFKGVGSQGGIRQLLCLAITLLILLWEARCDCGFGTYCRVPWLCADWGLGQENIKNRSPLGTVGGMPTNHQSAQQAASCCC